MCDFAVGLSRQLHGLTIASERPEHRMFEQWHPARPGRDHHRVQLPGRRLGLERGPGGRLRRHDDLEAVARDAADGDRRPAHRQPRGRGERLPGRVQPLPRRRRGRGRGDGRRHEAPADLGDRQHADGPARGVRSSPAGWADRCWNSAATTRSSSPSRPTSTCAARRAVRGGGHGGPAMHDAPPTDPPRVDRRRVPRPARGRLPERADRRPVGRGNADGPAHQRASRRRDDDGPPSRDGAGRGDPRRRPKARRPRHSSSSRRSSAPGPRCRSSPRRPSRRSSTR